MFINILKNGIESMSNGGEVVIRTERTFVIALFKTIMVLCG